MLRPPLRSTLFPYTTLFRSYKADVEQVKRIDQTTKEVQRYAIALNEGFKRIQQSGLDRKSTRLNSSHVASSYAVFCLKKKKQPSGATRPIRSPRRPSFVHRL